MPELHPVIATLKARREERGLSRTTVARRLGCAKNFVGQLERGERVPHLAFTESYAALLGLRLTVGPASAERDATYWRNRAEKAEAAQAHLTEQVNGLTAKLTAVGMVRSWTNEDGKKFVFVDALLDVLQPDLAREEATS